jgi:hypothetical protein
MKSKQEFAEELHEQVQNGASVSDIMSLLDDWGKQELPKQNDVREDDVEKLATEWLYNTLIDLRLINTDLKTTLKLVLNEAKQMELKAKENTYTEEQVREALDADMVFITCGLGGRNWDWCCAYRSRNCPGKWCPYTPRSQPRRRPSMILCLFDASASATTYYVDQKNPKAADTNTGTEEALQLGVRRACPCCRCSSRKSRAISRRKASRLRSCRRSRPPSAIN